MKVQVSESLLATIKGSRKNHNYSLSFLLNSIDSDVCRKCFRLIEEFKLSGNRADVEIDDSTIKTIQQTFGKVDAALIERLLWIAVLFPEI